MDMLGRLKNKLLHSSGSSRSIESRAIYFAAGAAGLSLIICLLVFQGSIALFGRSSVGSQAIVLSTVAAFVGYFYAVFQARPKPQKHTLYSVIHLYYSTFALSFVNAAIVFLLTAGGFYIIQNAFIGLTLDQYASSIIVAVIVSIMAYTAYLSGALVSTLRISTALAVFLVAGALISMITASDPYWWQLHLSSLGAEATASSFAFNLTLVIGGAVIVSIADFVAEDFGRLQLKGNYKEAKVNTLRTILVIIGILFACVGLFKYNTYALIHTLSAAGMALMFIALVVMLPKIVPSFSKAFFAFSFTILGALLVGLYLYANVGYLNLTAFEIVCFSTIFSWLIVFIRQIAAALQDEA